MLKWQRWRINRKFLQNLQRRHGYRDITLKEAYKLYAIEHSKKDFGMTRYGKWPFTTVVNDYYLQMNVRNHLAAAAYRGILKRISRGLYRFTTMDPKDWPVARPLGRKE